MESSSWSTVVDDTDSSLFGSSAPPTFQTAEVDTELNHSNHSYYDHYGNYTLGDDIIYHPAVQAIFYLVYGTIFSLGIFGNVLVCYVVGRNKAMQTVTNFFITNLALADILLCALAVPFTPLYTFLGEWIFGRILCHLVPYAQGTSVYISTLTLTSIAIDRFFVIIYPFKPRMRLTTCLLIITGIWVFALLATLPYGIFLHYFLLEDTHKYTCGESWPSEGTRQIFSGCTVTLQFILPFIIILFCYIKVSLKLSDRARSKPGSKNSKKEALERERKRRTNRMLIAMVFIFGMSWLPLNVFNFLTDLSADAAEWKYSNLTFFFSHAVAMSSTCYNPFLYAWLNENFRKEFKQVLPCFKGSNVAENNRSKRFVSTRTNCNGAETVQESLMPTTSQATANINAQPANATVNQVLDTIDEMNSTTQSALGASFDPDQVTASFNADTNEVVVHFPSPSFSSSSPVNATPGHENNAKNFTPNNNTIEKNKSNPSSDQQDTSLGNSRGAQIAASVATTIPAITDNNKCSTKGGSTTKAVVANKAAGSIPGKEMNTKESSSSSSGIEASGNGTMSPDTGPTFEEVSSGSCVNNSSSTDAINTKSFAVNASVII